MSKSIASALLLAAVAALTPLPAAAQDATLEHAAAEAAVLAQRYTPPALVFSPCADAPGMDCATLPVPIDYRRPDAGVVNLAVIRAKATSPGKRIGVLFGNPGGPGGSGYEFIQLGAAAPLFIALRERFDIVSFDVRGSHRSQAVSCRFPAPADPETIPPAQLPAHLDAYSQTLAHACVDQGGALITSLSTNNIARDIDVLRRALGESRITYFGQSFGTWLGAVYASLFPNHVRAMLLDSGVIPNARDGRVEFRSEQAVSFETTFMRLDQLCREDSACRLRDLSLAAAMSQLLARLSAAPVTSPSGRVLDATTLRRAVTALLSLESEWPLIIDAIADARAGNLELMFLLLDAFGLGAPATEVTVTAFTAILCNDAGTRRSAADYLRVNDAVAALVAHVEPRYAIAGSIANCAAWPEADVPIIRDVRSRLPAPVLLMGNDFDPNTPLSWTRSLAAALGMERSVVRYQGGGHLSFVPVPCMSQVGVAYLVDLALPAEGSSCAALPVRFDGAGAAGASSSADAKAKTGQRLRAKVRAGQGASQR